MKYIFLPKCIHLLQLWWVIIFYFLLFVLSTGDKVLGNSLVFQECFIPIDLPYVPYFDFLGLSNTFPSNFLLVFCFYWQYLHSCFLLFIGTRPDIVLICFCIFKSSVLVLSNCSNWVWCKSSNWSQYSLQPR